MNLFGYTIIRNKTWIKNKDKIKSLEQSIKYLNAEYKYIFEQLLLRLRKDEYPDLLKHWYYKETGKHLNLEDPKTFNEKIQWLKLYDSTPLKTQLADKYLARDYVKQIIGEEYLVPLLGVYDKFDDIDFKTLPTKFVIKCNHGSGYNIIVKDKSLLDIDEARENINSWLKEDFAHKSGGFELHYSDIKRKIIIEKYLETPKNGIMDYNVFCFDGKPEFILVEKDRFTNHKRNLYDLEWRLLDKKINNYENFNHCKKPKNLEKMINLAKKLSAGFKFVRVDFYENEEGLFFGELTFTTSSGISDIQPEEFALYLGSLIKI